MTWNCSSIDIMGVTFEIVEGTPDHNENNMGYINNSASKIFINERMSISQKRATLYHEFVHGVLDAIGESELSRNEDFVEKLSRALLLSTSLKVTVHE